jgi:hypothetical protein
MRTHAVAALLAGVMLSTSAVLPHAARAQSNPPQSSAGNVEAAPIGRVVTATGSVTIEHANAVLVQANVPGNGDIGRTKVGDPVYKGDVVQTGADGKVGITFTDGTAFNLSSNARMVLNEFVYDPNGTSNSTLFSLSKGTFTFIAGKVAKTGDMKIDTPIAVMGIRGTTPQVEISDDGTVRLSTLIEENKNSVTEKRGKIQENKRGAPVKREARRAGDNLDKNVDIKLKVCRDC